MEKETFGQELKQELISEETHLEWLGIKFGTNSPEYRSFEAKIEAKRRYIESIEGNQPPEVSRG